MTEKESASPVHKKARLNDTADDANDVDDDEKTILVNAIKAMGLYREYCEREDIYGDGDEDDDDDETMEENGTNNKTKTKDETTKQSDEKGEEDAESPPRSKLLLEALKLLLSNGTDKDDDVPLSLSLGAAVTHEDVLSTFTSVSSLIPVLRSVCHLRLWIEDNEKESCLVKSLRAWPAHPAALSVCANHLHMTRGDVDGGDVARAYARAADNARAVRKGAVEMLSHENEENDENNDDDDDDDDDDDEVKAWVEALLLDAATGTEYLGGDLVLLGEDDEEEEEEEEPQANDDDDDAKAETTKEKKSNDKKSDEAEEEENEPEQKNKEDNHPSSSEQEYSVSDVECTAAFMAALVGSTVGEHDLALRQLRKFRFTHRVHPCVWDAARTGATSKGDDVPSSTKLPFVPCRFPSPALPSSSLARLRRVFCPDAPYWSESDYEDRSYYSFWTDLGRTERPRDLVTEVIEEHLLPLARSLLPHDSERIVGAEWWTHTRPVRANLGHQLHFDTDERRLEDRREITHPVVSCVLCLTDGNGEGGGGEAGGATVVLEQTPDENAPLASRVRIGRPENNTLLAFPGNLLHGVVPCPGSPSSGMNEKDPVPHRLTLMVGFWTRRVPDGRTPQDDDDDGDVDPYYRPCGPLPPRGAEEHSWVDDLYEEESEEEATKDEKGDDVVVTAEPLPAVGPAWDVIDYDDEQDEEPLHVPPTMDHRSFVIDAKTFFRESLFKDEF